MARPKRYSATVFDHVASALSVRMPSEAEKAAGSVGGGAKPRPPPLSLGFRV